jgi:ceramide glucosyltransferase
LPILAEITATFAGVGLVQAGLAVGALKRFNRQPRVTRADRPPVTILKPLKGDEPLLEEALASFCTQSYPDYQIVFGVQDAADPAIAVVEKLRLLFPQCDITLVIDPTQHGGNGKVANLINMWPAARHDLIVLADSDIHVTPSFLDRMVTDLAEPRVGVATALYAGVVGGGSLAARFGAAQINHIFLPGVLVGRMIGREDCLGAAMAMSRATLARIGGFPALLPHLADDAAIGRLVHAQGLSVALAPTLVLTTVAETTLRELFRHELRWARTIRALAPVSYATSLLQYPVFWAMVTVLLAEFRLWSWLVIGVVWLARVMEARAMSHQLGRGGFSGLLLPLRELLSVVVLLSSYFGNRVVWRGRVMEAAESGNRTRLDKTHRLSRDIKQA